MVSSSDTIDVGSSGTAHRVLVPVARDPAFALANGQEVTITRHHIVNVRRGAVPSSAIWLEELVTSVEFTVKSRTRYETR